MNNIKNDNNIKNKESDILKKNNFSISEKEKLIKEKYFSREYIILNKLNERPLSFYKKRYILNLTISLFFVILTFLLTFSATLTLHFKSKEHKVFLTNINGETSQYKKTENRQKVIKKFINYHNNKGN